MSGKTFERMTRAQAQEKLDDLFARGDIDAFDWRFKTDLVGEPATKSYEWIFDLSVKEL